jgi:acyl-CoA reductase-like NAD-dependent aldehyde dehydrogenase
MICPVPGALDVGAMNKRNVMFANENALAVPLWINGHAYLTLAPAFQNVCNPVSGEVLRRTPLCGASEVRRALDSAQAAAGAWAAMPATRRLALIAAVGEELAAYAGHFASLIVEESGMDTDAANAEVAGAVSLLRRKWVESGAQSAAGNASAVLAVVGSVANPLFGVLRHAVPALMCGVAVIVRPSPETPAALFALAELTGRCGFPPGVFNLLHGGEAVLDGLRSEGIRLLFA